MWEQWKMYCKARGFSDEFAEVQFNLYINGVRDVRFSDECIYLIDNFGY